MAWQSKGRAGNYPAGAADLLASIAVPFTKLLDLREERVKARDLEPGVLLDTYLKQISVVIDAVDRLQNSTARRPGSKGEDFMKAILIVVIVLVLAGLAFGGKYVGIRKHSGHGKGSCERRLVTGGCGLAAPRRPHSQSG